jgi:thiamine biosynthesis protein ThiS
MQIVVNGSPRDISPATTVSGLLALLEVSPRGAAVEVNFQLVSRPQHAAHELCEGDQVEVVTLVGGG